MGEHSWTGAQFYWCACRCSIRMQLLVALQGPWATLLCTLIGMQSPLLHNRKPLARLQLCCPVNKGNARPASKYTSLLVHAFLTSRQVGRLFNVCCIAANASAALACVSGQTLAGKQLLQMRLESGTHSKLAHGQGRSYHCQYARPMDPSVLFDYSSCYSVAGCLQIFRVTCVFGHDAVPGGKPCRQIK